MRLVHTITHCIMCFAELYFVFNCICMMLQSSGSSGELGMKDREGRMFPGEERNENIACMSLGQDFLIYGTEVRFFG